ncbi:MAG: cache domain-containing protein [Thermodesulfobacteriota bacterium]
MKRFIARFSDLPISLKLLVSYFSVFVVTMLFGGLVIYYLVRSAIQANIESELHNTTTTILNMVRTAANSSIKNHLRAVAEQNRKIIEFIYRRQQEGLMTEAQAKSQAREILLSQTIGKTGYLYCADSRGQAPVHPNPGVEGGSFLQYKFVRDQIRLKEGYLEYEWRNPGEDRERPKALYMTYFAPWDWIISVSSYREEFAELVKVADFRDSILALRFGKTGYSFVLDSKGNPIVHPVLTGNVFDVPDAQGNRFVHEILRARKGKLIYSWKNPGETAFRDKLVIFDYIPEYDWIVASSCYLDESYAALSTVKHIVFATVLGTLLLVVPVTLVISRSILKPLKRLMHGLSAGQSGDLTVRMKAGSKDEVGQLAQYFNTFMEKLQTYQANLLAEIRERKQTEEALRESERKYRGILERMQEGYYELDLAGNFTFYNNALVSILGYPGDELLNRSICQIADQGSTEEISRGLTMIKNTGRATKASTGELVKKDGSVCSVESSISLIYDKHGNAVGFGGVLRDITKRKRSEEALRLSEEMFSKAFRCSPSGIIIAAVSDGRLINVNDSFLRLTRYSLPDVQGRSLSDAHFVMDHDLAVALLEEVHQHSRLSSRDVRFYTSSGEERSGVISAELVELWGEECMLAALEDITDSKRLEREILEISEREHQKIGRDLHDDLCPHLIGVEVLSVVLEQKLKSRSLGEAADASKIRALIQDSIKKLRRLARGLCPVDLEVDGFDSSLAALGHYVEDIFGVSYHLRCDTPIHLGNQTVATHLYYIAHEAVHNAVKHAGAKNIVVSLASVNGALELSIRDDGQGILQEYSCNGMGLRIMNYRAKRIGATLEIRQAAEGGTSVTLRVTGV